MTFFLTNPPSPEDSARDNLERVDEKPTQELSGKSRPLFKQDDELPDTLAGEHISLSAYISKHLHGSEQDDDETEAEVIPAKKTITPSFIIPDQQGRERKQTGIFLNSLDVEMPAGLEQYLPSPIFRLRIAKKRLDGEINELRMRINKYERLPDKAPALQEQITLLKQRLATLEKHQQEISQQLSANLSVVPTLYAFSQQGKGIGEWINKGLAKLRQFVLTLFYGDAFLKVQTDNDEMMYLKDLYAERLKSGTSDESELSAIINRFEQVAQRAENDARKLKPGSFPKRLWQEAKGLVK